jgi:hypothetical protein
MKRVISPQIMPQRRLDVRFFVLQGATACATGPFFMAASCHQGVFCRNRMVWTCSLSLYSRTWRRRLLWAWSQHQRRICRDRSAFWASSLCRHCARAVRLRCGGRFHGSRRTSWCKEGWSPMSLPGAGCRGGRGANRSGGHRSAFRRGLAGSLNRCALQWNPIPNLSPNGRRCLDHRSVQLACCWALHRLRGAFRCWLRTGERGRLRRGRGEGSWRSGRNPSVRRDGRVWSGQCLDERKWAGQHKTEAPTGGWTLAGKNSTGRIGGSLRFGGLAASPVPGRRNRRRLRGVVRRDV